MREFLRRALERGDAWPGLVLAALGSLVVAFCFAARWPAAIERAELQATDILYFGMRDPVPASPDVTLVYYDDQSARQVGFKRANLARLVRGLTGLGARTVAFDVNFVVDLDDAGPDGEIRLDPGTRFLAQMMRWSGRVAAVYNFEEELAPVERALLDRLMPAFREKLHAGVDELARASGVPSAAFRDDVEALRRHAIWRLVAERMDAEPRPDYPTLAAALLPDGGDRRHAAEAKQILVCWHAWRAMKAVAAHRLPVRVLSLPARLQRDGLLRPTVTPLMEQLTVAGHATTPTRDVDGVLRRAPMLLQSEHGLQVYMGLEVAARSLEDGTHRVELEVRSDRLDVVRRERGTGAEVRRIEFPLLADGSSAAVWAEGFDRVPFVRVVAFDERRYGVRPDIVTRAVRVAEASGAEELPERYRRWAPLWAELEASMADPDAPVERVRQLDAEADALTRQFLEDLRSDAEQLALAAADFRRRAETGSPRMKRDFERRAEELEQKSELRRRDAADLEASMADDLELRAKVEGRICIVGSASTALGDLYSTPVGNRVPGVDLHANAASMVLTGEHLRPTPPWMHALMALVAGLAVAWTVTYRSTLVSSVTAAGLVVLSVAACVQVGSRFRTLLPAAGPPFAAAVAFTVGMSYRELVTRRSRRRLQKELERRMSPGLVAIILADPERFAKPRRMEASIFFSDIKGFTSISEGMDPEVLIAFINRYHDRMTRILLEEQGFVDKYIGDGIMALFGAPVALDNHPLHACRAALRNVAATRELADEFEREGLPRISIRVGLHTAEITSAYVGSAMRADPTAIGDGVNLASRLEGANKGYGTQIMASESVVERAGGRFWFRELDCIRVVGRRKGVRVFELLGERTQACPLPDDFMRAYEAGMEAFRRREWADALASFERAAEVRPEDAPARMFVSRSQGFLMNPPPPDWEGVFELTSK